MHVSMKRSGGEAGQAQAVCDLVCIALGGSEYNRLFYRAVTQQMIKQTILVQQVIDKMHTLRNIFMAS
jgi:hypothetical protein